MESYLSGLQVIANARKINQTYKGWPGGYGGWLIVPDDQERSSRVRPAMWWPVEMTITRWSGRFFSLHLAPGLLCHFVQLVPLCQLTAPLSINLSNVEWKCSTFWNCLPPQLSNVYNYLAIPGSRGFLDHKWTFDSHWANWNLFLSVENIDCVNQRSHKAV